MVATVLKLLEERGEATEGLLPDQSGQDLYRVYDSRGDLICDPVPIDLARRQQRKWNEWTGATNPATIRRLIIFEVPSE